MQTRALTPADEQQVRQLEMEAFFAVSDMLYKPNAAWGVFIDDSLIGFCSVEDADIYDEFKKLPEWTPDSRLIGDVYISAKYRGRGYGKHLVQAVADATPEPVFCVLFDSTMSKFYQSIGFELRSPGLVIRPSKL